MNQIEYNGKMYDCYTLRTCRKFIKAIADGTKTIETRALSEHNCKMFVDMDIVAANKLRAERGEEPECVCKPVYFLRLHDQHGVEVLCLIDDNGLSNTHPDGIKDLQDRYDFHEFDDNVEEVRKYGSNYIYDFFFFHIAEVLETKGI